MKSCFFWLFILVLPLLPIKAAMAQNVSQMNFSSVNVDNLSDEQISQFMQQVRRTGMTDNQIDQVALAKGMSPQQLQKLKARIEKIKAGDSSKLKSLNAGEGKSEMVSPSFTFGARDTTKSGIGTLEKALEALKPKIFGEELFRNSKISFEPNLNLPTPQNYTLGPADELVINIYGYSQADYRLTVSKDGSINIPNIGLIYVNGLTIDEATKVIKARLATVYSAIKSGKTSVQVGLGTIRSINVTLMGEVTMPGTYTLPSLATVFNALYAAGGPSRDGSYRDIEVIRDNKIIEKLDVYDFLMSGDQSKNIRLEDQDVIRIPVYQDQVQIMGRVKRPGLYQLQPGENLADLITYAGGFADNAYTAMIHSVRVNGKEKTVADIPSADFGSFDPKNGDKFSVSTILDKYANRVLISGAVYRPGQFQLTKGMTLSQLIKKADGLREDAFLPRGYIVRQNPDLTTSSIQFDVAAIMDGKQENIPLQKEDQVHIYSIFDLRDQYSVGIDGSVRNPGNYKYSDSMTVEELIQEAGGFTEGASPRRIEVSRRYVDTSNAGLASAHIAEVFQENVGKDLQLHTNHFTLQPFDIVTVRDLPGYEPQKEVRVKGEVMYPGLYTLTKKDERISDIVKRAGGLTELAYPQGASLKRTAVTDSSGLARIKQMQFEKLQRSLLRDTAGSNELKNLSVHNDFVGIHLDKIVKDPYSKYDLSLQNGDVLYVPRRLQTIKVNGEVLYPVITPYQKGRKIRYYISQAGGFANDAKKNRVYVVNANGFVKSTHNFLFIRDYPPVKPGSEIFVPLKPQNKLNTQQVLGITTGVTSLTLTIIAILNLLK